jgi:glutathione S-transferase
MKLFYSQGSPFVRKVLVLAHEAGLAQRIELTSVGVLPTQVNADVGAINPLTKVPTLVLDDGESLYDSRVIAEYLDSLSTQKFFPASGAARWTALRIQATADGICDAAILVRYEIALRAADKQSSDWMAGQMRKVRAGLDALETEPTFAASIGIGEIATACALGYLDFRFATESWRASHPRLAAFYEAFAARPSMLATRPPQS